MHKKQEAIGSTPLFCLKCGHVHYVEEGADICPVCGDKLVEKPTPEEAKAFSVKVHDDRTKATEKWNNAMCFVVLGSIALIIGVLFVILSLKKVRNQIAGINFASFQFVVAVLALVLGAAALAYGLYGVIRSVKATRIANKEINLVGNLYPKAGPR